MLIPQYKLIETNEELTAFVPAWCRLWHRDPQAFPFQSPEWLLPWWRQFGNGHLCSLAITHGADPVGFLPFYIFPDAQKGQRQLLPLGVGTTDYLDGVFAPECRHEDIAGAVEYLCESSSPDLFCVPQLPAHSRLLAAISNTDRPGALLSTSEACSRMPAVTMPELPQKIRRNAMYYRNRAQRLGTLDLAQADASNWNQIFNDLCQLHASRWSKRGQQGVLADDRVLQWHREAIPNLLGADMLRLMALRLNGETIAVLYSLIDREREHRAQYFYITAYSPAHADLRPGTLLIACAVERAAREQVTTIDMLRGDETYKQIWHTQKIDTWCLTRYPEADRADAAA